MGVGRGFAPMTQWTSNPKARLSLAMVAALHVNTVFGETVERWRRGSEPRSGASTRCRDPASYHVAPGSHLCAWHLYVKHKHELQADETRLNESDKYSIIDQKRSEFGQLEPVEQARWKYEAFKSRRQ